jgi:hypothetical protein
MRTTVLVMAIAVIFEPIRIGLAVWMLNRPRPLLQLLVFLCGGFFMGIGAGLVILFVLRTTPLASGNVEVAKVQIAIGIIALLVAALVASNISLRPRARRRQPARSGAGGDADSPVPADPEAAGPAVLRTRRLAGRSDSLVVAWVSGMMTALPSANYIGAIAVILASGVPALAQAQALLLFNVVAFTLVEIPLLSFLVAPAKTRKFMAALHSWLRARPRRDLAALVAGGGCVILAIGLFRL